MLIIDRFEGEFAVLEADGQPLQIPRRLLPATAREGDMLTIGIDWGQTAARRAQMKTLLDTLFEE